MRSKKHPSDTSCEQFELIWPLLEGARKKTKRRMLDLYELCCAVLYLLRTGCQWRAARRPSQVAHRAFVLRQMDLIG